MGSNDVLVWASVYQSVTGVYYPLLPYSESKHDLGVLSAMFTNVLSCWRWSYVCAYLACKFFDSWYFFSWSKKFEQKKPFYILESICFSRIFVVLAYWVNVIWLSVQVLKKLDMIRKNDIERILAERNILITVRNPFVVIFKFNCYFSFSVSCHQGKMILFFLKKISYAGPFFLFIHVQR